jgi:hypothetical protein
MLRLSLLGIVGCARVGAAQTIAVEDLVVAPLPACYVFRFDGKTKPEADTGAFPDTITLTRPFELYTREAEGHVYAGTWPDSLLPQSIPMANVFPGQLVTWWTGTADSLILGAPGTLMVVSIHLNKELAGVWYEKHDLGRSRTGTLRLSRISCRKH